VNIGNVPHLLPPPATERDTFARRSPCENTHPLQRYKLIRNEQSSLRWSFELIELRACEAAAGANAARIKQHLTGKSWTLMAARPRPEGAPLTYVGVES